MDHPDNSPAVAGELLTTKQVAEITGFAEITLATWRVKGWGPRWYKLGRKAVRYDSNDVHAWMRSQYVGSTAEVTANARTA